MGIDSDDHADLLLEDFRIRLGAKMKELGYTTAARSECKVIRPNHDPEAEEFIRELREARHQRQLAAAQETGDADSDDSEQPDIQVLAT